MSRLLLLRSKWSIHIFRASASVKSCRRFTPRISNFAEKCTDFFSLHPIGGGWFFSATVEDELLCDIATSPRCHCVCMCALSSGGMMMVCSLFNFTMSYSVTYFFLLAKWLQNESQIWLHQTVNRTLKSQLTNSDSQHRTCRRQNANTTIVTKRWRGTDWWSNPKPNRPGYTMTHLDYPESCAGHSFLRNYVHMCELVCMMSHEKGKTMPTCTAATSRAKQVGVCAYHRTILYSSEMEHWIPITSY